MKSGLCNILDDAIRYTEKEGIKIAAEVAENNSVITVADTGI